VDSTKPVAIEIEKAEQREALKQALLFYSMIRKCSRRSSHCCAVSWAYILVRLDGTLALHNKPASP
jgi:hypothetical protein